MSEVESMLNEWQVGPDPLKIVELIEKNNISDEDIKLTGTILPELKNNSNPNLSSIKSKFLKIFPYFYKMYDQVNELYPKETILFAGRDARILYVFFKALAKLRNDNDRFIQVPGSREFYKLSGLNPDKEVKLLESFQITKKNIERGDKYIFIDTGFEGTVGISFRNFVSKTLGIRENLSEQIPIMLVSSYIDDSSINQLNDFGKIEGQMKTELKEYIRHKIERGITKYAYVNTFSKINDYIAIIMQNIPQYHGPYNKTVEYKNRVMAVSDGRGSLSDEPPLYEINPDFINPVGALMIDCQMIREMINNEK